jgi:spermidine dehydrogenase
MQSTVTRRDFLNGVALTIGASALPLDELMAAADGAPYPPALTGLRGSTDAAYAVMHGIARDYDTYSFDTVSAEEVYDLVVVGAGLAGLSAAWFYREKNPGASILILDNHDDFGGHARRNEFDANGRMLLSYGGSESMVSPRSEYAEDAHRMFKALGLDPERFYDEAVFHRTLYPGLKLARGVFFDAKAFGQDKLVAGDPMVLGYDEFSPAAPNSRPIEAFIADCPLSDQAKAGIVALVEGSKDFMAGKSKEEKLKILGKTSYRDFIEKICGLPKDAADYFQGRLNDNFGLGIDTIAASDAMGGGLPGADGLGIAQDVSEGEGEPYIHHFPDGNATIARLIVRSLIPAIAPGKDMTDVVTARFDYGKLDTAESKVRIRLRSTAVQVKNEGDHVFVGYVEQGAKRRVRAGRAVVACYGMVMPHIVPEMAPEAKKTHAGNSKSPLLYCKALIRNWESFAKLGVHNIAAPMSFLSTVKLDYPVSLGSYVFPKDPKEPMVVHMVHVPLMPGSGKDAREQCRGGRTWLIKTPFETIEGLIRADLQKMLGPGGFDHQRDIMALTVNRWSHGYSYYWNSLYDDTEKGEADAEAAKKPIGKIAFANSDTAFDAYAHAAIAEAAQAAGELG